MLGKKHKHIAKRVCNRIRLLESGILVVCRHTRSTAES